MVVDIEKSRICPDCDTPLSKERWSEGLCPVCVFELALDDSIVADGLVSPDEAPTLLATEEGLSEGSVHGERYRIRVVMGRCSVEGVPETVADYGVRALHDLAPDRLMAAARPLSEVTQQIALDQDKDVVAAGKSALKKLK